jgi:predicted porin
MLLLLTLCVLGITAAHAQGSNRFNFNVGGGFGGAFGDVGKATGFSYNGVAGGGLNLSRSFGVKAEYMYFKLGFDDQVKTEQHLPGATGNVQSATLNLVFNHALQGKVGVYAIGGAGWYRRSLDTSPSQFLPAGTHCEPTWALWGITCTTSGFTDVAQTLASNTVDGGGYNFGGGFTYRLRKRTRLYFEGRYHHAYTSDKRTTLFPVTIGLRW